MATQVDVDTRRGPVEWSLEPPAKFNVMRRLVPGLGYPWEVSALGDWDFPPTCHSNATDETRYGDHPRVDLMPPTGVLVWLLMGDLKFDYEVEPRSEPPFLPYQRVAPSDTSEPTSVAPLGQGDRAVGYGGNQLSSWARLLLLTAADGSADDAPLYLLMRVWAGPQRSSIRDVNSLITSLTFRYTG